MFRCVAVGYDGSDHSQAALETAIGEARARVSPLRVLYVVPTPPTPAPYEVGWTPPPDPGEPADDYEQVRATAELILSTLASDMDYEIVAARASSPAGALVERSEEFALLVLGARGRGGFKGLLLGSTSAQVAAHARCPVMVTRERASEGPHPDAIVVGVDGSPLSPPVLEFAFDNAAVHREPLVAVHAWHLLYGTGFGDLPLSADTMNDIARQESALLTETLRPHRERYPDVPVSEVSAQGPPRQVLLEHAHGCRTVVVGDRGEQPVVGMLLGSTSQAVLHHAQAPVVLVGSR